MDSSQRGTKGAGVLANNGVKKKRPRLGSVAQRFLATFEVVRKKDSGMEVLACKTSR